MDQVFEPFMDGQLPDSPLIAVFGAGKGSGAAMLFCVIGIIGVAICLIFSLILKRYRWSEFDT